MSFLVFLSFFIFWIIVGNSEREPNWRMALVQSAIIWATYMVLGTEILSVFHAITRVALVVMWILPILFGIVWTWIWLKRGKVLRLPIVYRRDSWGGTILDLFVILILVITAVVAFVSPPNSNDAMISDMSRVAHWAQDHSLSHYATEIETQNSNAPGAEIMQLNFYILSDADRGANMVAWIAFAGSVAAAASLAEALGAKVNGQRMAAVFAATLPVAITQATSATNDIVVSFWVISAVLMLLYYARKNQKPFILVLAALAAGLGVVTKATVFIFLWPFALYAVVVLRQRLGMGRMLLWALTAFAILGLLNAGYFLRNHNDYGQFYRPAELAGQTNEIRNWRVLVSNITRNASLHADFPLPRADSWLSASLLKLHDRLGLSINDSRTTLGGDFAITEINTSERTSGNPLHSVVFIFCFVGVVGMVILGKQNPQVLVYAGAIFFSLLLFCYLLKWQPSGGLLQLPFFFLFAPMVAFILDKLEQFQVETVIAALFLAYAIPWLFQTQERPVFPDPARTYPMSVFSERRELLYFATNPEDYPVYKAMTDEINERGIRQVGLNLTDDSEEYPLWVMLDAPDDALRIDWLASDPASEKYLASKFEPDAIICEQCATTEINAYSQSLERIYYGTFDLFVRPAQ
ncbi:glycosyltransferase family 39 protein [bacterium]|nr:glycosyltransferase family 39 protein [bacterium]